MVLSDPFSIVSKEKTTFRAVRKEVIALVRCASGEGMLVIHCGIGEKKENKKGRIFSRRQNYCIVSAERRGKSADVCRESFSQ